MGAAATMATHRLDLRNQTINYELLLAHIKLQSHWSLQRIKQLDVSSNKLCAMPPEIKLMINLKEIFAMDNWLKHLPMELRELEHLHLINVKGNQLQAVNELQLPLPLEWQTQGNTDPLKRLEVLSNMQLVRLGHNKLRTLPDRLGQLQSLRMVVANNNQLIAVAQEIFNSTTLLGLVLSHNKLVDLPENLGNAIALRTLVLSNNQIMHIPESLVRIRGLERLHLESNRIEEIPRGWMFMTGLRHLDISENKLNHEKIMKSEFPRLAPRLETFYIKPGNGYTDDWPEHMRGLLKEEMILPESAKTQARMQVNRKGRKMLTEED